MKPPVLRLAVEGPFPKGAERFLPLCPQKAETSLRDRVTIHQFDHRYAVIHRAQLILQIFEFLISGAESPGAVQLEHVQGITEPFRQQPALM